MAKKGEIIAAQESSVKYQFFAALVGNKREKNITSKFK